MCDLLEKISEFFLFKPKIFCPRNAFLTSECINLKIIIFEFFIYQLRVSNILGRSSILFLSTIYLLDMKCLNYSFILIIKEF